MNKLIIVTGVPRSGTSMMMRCLEMGGIRCVYNETPNINNAMKNPYGFFENGIIPNNGGVACKRFGKMILQKLSDYDCYFIFMNRSPQAVALSWVDIAKASPMFRDGNPEKFPFENRVENIRKQKQQILDYISDKKHIKIEFEDMFNNTIPTLTLLKDFLPLPFDVEKAAGAVDRTLYVEREGQPTPPPIIVLTPEQTAEVATLEAELATAKAQRDSVVAPLDAIVAEKRRLLKLARNPELKPAVIPVDPEL